MSTNRILRALAGPAAIVAISYLVQARLAAPPAGAGEQGLVLVPFVLDEVRVPGRVAAQVLVYDPSPGRTLRLRALRVLSGADVLHEQELDIELHGDPRYGAINALIERLPVEATELHRARRFFAAPGDPELEGHEVIERRREIAARLDAYRAELAAGAPRPFAQIDFPAPLDQLFFADEAPGARAALTVEVDYAPPGGPAATARVAEIVTYLGPSLAAPTTLGAGSSVSVHAGDLHVHSCHGEALNACAPSTDCAAETLQTSGSFTYAQLRTQYEALGLDWFTASDHSYCINSDAEYQAIVDECAALTDATFVCVPDTELSSDEVGPQQGSDGGDLLCFFGTHANHMGAHDITQRVYGGEDGFLGFCNGIGSDVLEPFTDNVDLIRGMGGYPIANHPAASSFGWNSVQALAGIEGGGLHGIEVWNGASQSGQGGHVGMWVDWLLAGRILYCYSGSDTHDEAFAFGANHVVLIDQPFTRASLTGAIQAGRVYLSEGHVALIEVWIGGQDLFMGTIHQLPANAPPAPLTVRVHYDFGADTGTITIFRGRAGDGAESVLCQSPPLSGAGVFECADVLATGATSWYRACSEGASKVAYTNPVFFVVGGDDPFAYCTAKPNSLGCVPAVTWSGIPSATAPDPFDVGARDVLSQQFGILFYGYAPALTPFQGGTLCVQPPITRTPVQTSGGNPPPGGDCSGEYHLDFNAWIQSGIDPGLTPGTTVFAQHWSRDPQAASGTGLSDALQFTVRP